MTTHIHREATLIFNERGNPEVRWTLHWPGNGEAVNLVPFEMHFADGSGGGGEMLLGFKEIQSLVRDVIEGRDPCLSRPLREFIEE